MLARVRIPIRGRALPLPARIFRRHEAADRHRHGADDGAVAADRRRADNRTRRHLEVATIDLLKELQSQIGCSVMFISHHLGVIAELCEEVVVMYAGEVVERGRLPMFLPAGSLHCAASGM